jgi:hypothetical protein
MHSNHPIRKLLCLLLISIPAHPQPLDHAAHSNLDFTSSDAQLVSSFRWARQQALSYVSNSDPVGPWYEAALPGRHAFCVRDTAHQADGAQALGLSHYNHNMLHRFAQNISASKDWCTYWEIDRSGRPPATDYKSDTQFWYNLPANYDVLDACYRMFLWTGDRSYIDDPAFLNFYDRTIADYTARWSLTPDLIMQRRSDIETHPFFRGDPTYEESSSNNLVGIDLLATQFSAYRSYAAIQAIRGNTQAARNALQNAAQVNSLINTLWWNPTEGYFYAFFNKQHQFTGQAGGDLLYRNAVDDAPKTASALRTLQSTINTEPKNNVEAKSHYAEIFYNYGNPEAAYSQIIDLTREGRKRREYPEVSYSVIGALVTGLMGIRVEPTATLADLVAGKPFATVVETLPQLTEKTSWAELRNLPVQSTVITVRHEGNQSTTLTNQGPTALEWKACFTGSFPTLLLDGKPLKTHSTTTNPSRTLTWTQLTVPPGTTLQIKTP